MKTVHIVIIFIIFIGWIAPLVVTAQNKVPAESKRDRKKRAETDPWAEFEDEIDSIPRWDFGINLGAYFPNKYSANFYNGNPDNVNNVKYVMSNKYWYQEIKNLLHATDTVFVQGYPSDMHYQVAFTGGLFVRFNFNRKNGIFLEANYTQLKANAVVTMEVDPKPFATFQDIRTIPILGKEARVMVDLGYQRSFPLKSKIYFFLQGGVIMCYTRVLKSVFLVENREYNLINVYGSQGYIPNSNSQTYNIHQSAYGFGAYFGGGAGIPLNDLFGVEPGFSMQYYPVNLDSYPQWKPSFSVYFRILLGAGKTGR
ncbi:MAG: hypothetical protein ISR57_04680 [Bacteroidales bacterium]|nr:hypothetical protein [Bacteroidota bacterium]MBL6949923.1 hypothetical protein [Bacteroidales bacterium]